MKVRRRELMAVILAVLSFSIDAKTNEGWKVDNHEERLSKNNNSDEVFIDWGINDEELNRFKALMAGPRGLQSPTIDPLSALGIESRNDAERRHYAELWVKQEYERTEKELKFQREVDAAWKRLMPNMLPVNMGNAAGIAHDSGGRLALFVREADCQRCDARLSAVLADKRPVDIYLVDSEGSDQKLRNWAQQHRIPAEQVRERRITLNHDAGRWLRYGNGIMPVLLQQGESGWHIAAF